MYVRVRTPENSKLIQEFLFKEGFKWRNGNAELLFMYEDVLCMEYHQKHISYGLPVDYDHLKELTILDVFLKRYEDGIKK